MSDENTPTPDAATSSHEVYSRTIEPEPSVTITDQTFFGHGWQPLTIATLQAIWFMPQGAEFTVEDLVDWFRRMGWKSANGKPLGHDAVRRELALIRAAGYIRAERIRGEAGRVTGIRYEISKRPRPTGDRRVRFASDESEISRSLHMPPMAMHGESPHMADGAEQQVTPYASNHQTWPMTGMEEHAKPQVAPYASNDLHPPHPPEEEDSSSPNPLTRTTHGVKQHADQFTAEELAAAAAFLQQMKRWQAGGATARKCAPRLLRTMRKQGWPALAELDDEQAALLETEILKNTAGAKSWIRCLPGWVEDLRLYDRVRTRAAAQGSDRRERCLDHPARYRVGCADCAMAVPS